MQISINYVIHIILRIEYPKKNPTSRDQALNDASSGQLGDEPRADDDVPDSAKEGENSRFKAARKISREGL